MVPSIGEVTHSYFKVIGIPGVSRCAGGGLVVESLAITAGREGLFVAVFEAHGAVTVRRPTRPARPDRALPDWVGHRRTGGRGRRRFSQRAQQSAGRELAQTRREKPASPKSRSPPGQSNT